MGCSCQKNNTASSGASLKKEGSTNKSNKIAKKDRIKTIISDNNPVPDVVVRGVCDELYDELMLLDGKTYDLFKRTRLDGNGDDYQWLQVQKKIREWKSVLKEKCPDEFELGTIRELINTEYAKLF